MYIHGFAFIFAFIAYFFYIPFFLFCFFYTDYTEIVGAIGLFGFWAIYKIAYAINIQSNVAYAHLTTSTFNQTLTLGRAIDIAFPRKNIWTGFKATTGEVCVQIEIEADDKLMEYLAKSVIERKSNPAFRFSRKRNELKPKGFSIYQKLLEAKHRDGKPCLKLQLIAHARPHCTGWWSYSYAFDHGYVGLINDDTNINDVLTWEDIERYIYPE